MKNSTNSFMLLLPFLSVIFFTACTTSSISDANQQPQSKPEVNEIESGSESPTPTAEAEIVDENSWDYIIDNTPRVTYDDIKSNEYNNQWVILNATVDNKVEYKNYYYNRVECDCWLPRGNTYRIQKIKFKCEELDGYDPTVIQVGNNIDICLFIYSDASFGSLIKAFNITSESISIPEIHDVFKENCMPLNCEDILRAPDNFSGTDYIVSGTVFQIISDKDDHVELLLSTADQDEYIHVTYNYSENEPKMLENDSVTVYGTYYKLFDYTSLLGTKRKVPSIAAQFIDNQNLN